MGRRFPNPIRLSILWIGLGLARLGLIERERARRTTDLAWPRIVTGLARMSKSAVDVAMVGVAVGPAAIAGVGFATPFWGLAFTIGGGAAGGTIALVSQRYGAERFGALGQAVRSSTVLVVGTSAPLVALFWLYPTALVSVITDDPEAIALGADYLQVVGLGVPFAGLNLIGSRTFVGMDDAWTPMVIRAGGALANVGLNAVLIFGFGMGVVGAALGTVLSNLAVTLTFALALGTGRLPAVTSAPVIVDPTGQWFDVATTRDLIEIGLPVAGRNFVWTVAEFPLLGIVDIFGQDIVAAYVISRRIWGLLNTPGWGFGLAASSLVGQELGKGDEAAAERYGREIIRFAVAVYAIAAASVFVFAEPITLAFVDDPTELSIPVAVTLVQVACVAIVFRGVAGASEGPLDASGDTRWPFYSQLGGMFGCAIPLAYLGATTPLGLTGLYLAFVAETAVPAAINYYRFSTGRWKEISRSYRVQPLARDD